MQVIVRRPLGIYAQVKKDQILDVVECKPDDVVCRVGRRDFLWMKWDEVEVVVTDGNGNVLNTNVKGS